MEYDSNYYRKYLHSEGPVMGNNWFVCYFYKKKFETDWKISNKTMNVHPLVWLKDIHRNSDAVFEFKIVSYQVLDINVSIDE